MPKKPTGEIGGTRITAGPDGQTAEIMHADLPESKEQLEATFANIFVQAFNEQRPLGPDVQISNLMQNQTNDLDFSILSSFADYIELAELNPRSEAFGRTALKTGVFNVYEYARWIFWRIIRKKARLYGQLSQRAILLLYVTHWQFVTSQRINECLKSFSQNDGCNFAAVFILLTNGSDLRAIELVHPYAGPPLPAPSKYSGFKFQNFEPGRHSWTPSI
jgi:hypothetical protein